MNLIERLISQLDTLVAFLALSRQEIFAIIQEHHAHWFSAEDQEALPGLYTVYQTQVTHAAFVLGYSYVDAFLADLMRKVYADRPEALPHEKELKFRDILKVSTYDDVIDYMIEKEVRAVMYNSMDNIIDYFQKRLGLDWPSSERGRIVEANLLRNFIVHNNAVADSRLATRCERWTNGTTIALTTSDVHSFGIAARAVARDLYRQAEQRHFSPPAT